MKFVVVLLKVLYVPLALILGTFAAVLFCLMRIAVQPYIMWRESHDLMTHRQTHQTHHVGNLRPRHAF